MLGEAHGQLLTCRNDLAAGHAAAGKPCMHGVHQLQALADWPDKLPWPLLSYPAVAACNLSKLKDSVTKVLVPFPPQPAGVSAQLTGTLTLHVNVSLLHIQDHCCLHCTPICSNTAVPTPAKRTFKGSGIQ